MRTPRLIRRPQGMFAAIHLDAIRAGIRALIPVRGDKPVSKTREANRKKMRYGGLDLDMYHQRSKVETVFSVMNSMFGSGIRSVNEDMMEKELLYRVLAYNCHRLYKITHDAK